MDQNFISKATPGIYLEIAARIVEEMETRGFTTDNQESAQGLVQSISCIIQDVINKNYTFVVPNEDFNELYNGPLKEQVVSFNPWNNIQNEIS